MLSRVQALGARSLPADFGVNSAGTLHTDAGAAIEIVRRKGLGKLRHLNVRDLWLQDQVRAGTNLVIAKVPGPDNTADVVTKHFNAEAVQRHFSRLHITRSSGRAQSAPTRAAMRGRASDEWAKEAEEGETVRVHHGPRRSLFTPVGIKDAPPARSLAKSRITICQFISEGNKFRIVDNLNG